MMLPKDDKHFSHPEIYQKGNYKLAKSFVTNFYSAVDVGAHVGIWSNYMADDFRKVIAFEPQPDNYECLAENVNKRVEHYNLALGNAAYKGRLVNPAPGNSGAWELKPHINGDVDVSFLDLFGLDNVGLIKVDVQGYELEVLSGAIETIRDWRPVIVVEVKHNNVTNFNIVKFLERLDYEIAASARKDFIFTYKR